MGLHIQQLKEKNYVLKKKTHFGHYYECIWSLWERYIGSCNEKMAKSVRNKLPNELWQ